MWKCRECGAVALTAEFGAFTGTESEPILCSAYTCINSTSPEGDWARWVQDEEHGPIIYRPHERD